MIYCNLSGLMAAKKVNISDVSRDTGISRTTLTGLYYNAFKGIQVDTLNVLCRYFNVTTDRLLCFSRYDIAVKLDSMNSDLICTEEKKNITAIVDFEVSAGEIKKEIETCCIIYLDWREEKVLIEADIGYFEPDSQEEKENNDFLKKALSSLNAEIKAYIEALVKDVILKNYESDFDNREIDFSMYMEL